MKIYTVVHTYTDYAYPADSFTNIRCSCNTIELARREVGLEIDEAFDKDEWDSEDEYADFVKAGYRSEDCWVNETADCYVEINIVENELVI